MAVVVGVGDLAGETLGTVELAVEDVAEAGKISRTSLSALQIGVDEEVVSSVGDEETSVVISAVAVVVAVVVIVVEVIFAVVETSAVAAVVVVLRALESSSKYMDSHGLCVIFCVWIG